MGIPPSRGFDDQPDLQDTTKSFPEAVHSTLGCCEISHQFTQPWLRPDPSSTLFQGALAVCVFSAFLWKKLARLALSPLGCRGVSHQALCVCCSIAAPQLAVDMHEPQFFSPHSTPKLRFFPPYRRRRGDTGPRTRRQLGRLGGLLRATQELLSSWSMLTGPIVCWEFTAKSTNTPRFRPCWITEHLVPGLIQSISALIINITD